MVELFDRCEEGVEVDVQDCPSLPGSLGGLSVRRLHTPECTAHVRRGQSGDVGCATLAADAGHAANRLEMGLRAVV